MRSRPRRSTALYVCSLLAVIAVWMAVPAAAAAATRYVDRGNASCTDSGTGAGTAATPHCTIGAAAALATGGTTVQVSSGTYTEQVAPKSGTSAAAVVFQPDPGETVVVRGRDRGFYVSGKSWVTIEGFTVTETVSDGIRVSGGSSNIKLIGNTVSLAGQPVSGKTAKGISVTDSTNVTVRGNVLHHNSTFGIYLASTSNSTVVGNSSSFNARVYSRAASGIRLYSASNNTISSNVTHDNEDSGIELVTGSRDNVVVNNVSYGNGDHGIDNLDAPGQRIVGNSIYDNVTAGINAEGNSPSTTMANNISVDNGIASPRTTGNIRIDSTSIPGSSIDYDLVHLRSPGVMFVWGVTNYSSHAAFKLATGQEPNGLQGDPRWAAPASGDFRLTGGSPAIDSANSGAIGAAATDVEGTARVDDPSQANTGAGPRAFDDRGAYERAAVGGGEPTASVTVTPSTGAAPLSVTADASGSTAVDGTPIATYRFDFGDGTVVGPQAGATASHTYTTAGSHTVTVTVTDTGGLSATATRQVTVSGADAPPSASLTLSPRTGTAPLAVTADASGSTPGSTPISTYRFDFGDGTVEGPQAAATANHTYPAAGTYTVTVTVADTGGRSSTATDQVTVSQPQSPPNAVLTVSPGSGRAPVTVSADASGSTDNGDSTPIATYRFDFGDGTITGPQAGATASHTYTTAGSYTVRVTVTDTGGQSASATAEVVVSGNLVANPGFETSLSGWNTAGSTAGIVLDRVAGGHSGGWAARASNSTAATGTCTLNDAPNVVTSTAEGSYTASMWVRAETGGSTLRLRIREYQGTALVQTVTENVGLTTSWQQVTLVLHQPAAVGSSSLDLNAYVVGAAPGVCFDADDISLELGPAIPPPPPSANLVANGGFEQSLSGWSTGGSGAGVTLAREAGGHSGDWAARLDNTSAAASTCVLNDAPNAVATTAAGTYTASIWVRGATAGAKLRLRFREYSGTTLMATQQTEVPLTTEWQEVTLASVPVAPGASTLDLNAMVVGAAPGTCLYADDASIVLG